jgi:DAK2 domain fusion protein YloV
MSIKELDGYQFTKMLASGYEHLLKNIEHINDLNVFPVPDGDTGNNMKATYENGLINIKSSKLVGVVANSFALATLLGARGNSGVILSQYFKGIALTLVDSKVLTTITFVNALINGYKLAYASVVKPVEGTMLTVMKDSIENIRQKINPFSGIDELLNLLCDSMKNALINTPNQLNVLKQAGVVDSGGAGILIIFQGMLLSINDVKSDTSFMFSNKINQDYLLQHKNDEFGYCTEFILKVTNPKFNYQQFYDYLLNAGESLVVAKNNNDIKVHIHILKTEDVMRYAKLQGTIVSLKIEDMQAQNKKVVLNSLKVPFGIVSIAQGDGLIDLFKSLGSDIVINGGQTMNTSTEEILSAFSLINADNIIVFPNNKNIYMAAKQASNIYDKANIIIMETNFVTQCYFALSMLVKTEKDVNQVVKRLKKSFEGSDTLLITQSVRDALVNDVQCIKDDYIGLLNNKIVNSSNNILECIKNSLKKLSYSDKSICVIFIGQKQNELIGEEIQEYINETYPDLEVGVLTGGQDVFDLIIGII